MNAEQLIQLAETYEENKDFITNEETAKMSLVVPFIRLLGYDPNLPREVRLEYSADFVQGDGKKLPDRMDFAIFDRNGAKPLFVIETKPLGTNLQAKSQQLARYIAQLPELHFGIMTDGCEYLFYGDLDEPNQMCAEPYFSFSLADTKTDWHKVAKFLSNYSRDIFNAEILKTEAENNRFRQAMVEKLVKVLRSPGDDEAFMKWLTTDIVTGKRTASVMSRMNDVAKESIEPALLRLMGDEFVEKLKARISAAGLSQSEPHPMPATVTPPAVVPATSQSEPKNQTVTSAEEMRFFEIVKSFAVKLGTEESRIMYKDTVNYFNVSIDRPTIWFIRFFGDQKRKNLVTPLPVEMLKELAPGYEVDAAPPAFGTSRLYLESVEQVSAFETIVAKCIESLNRD